MKAPNIAVYGTLRKGYGLNEYLQPELATFVGTKWIEGYQMFTFHDTYWSYPVVAKTDNPSDKVEVELYEFHDNLSAFQSAKDVDGIELGAGYHIEQIEHEGKEYNIYLQDIEYCEDELYLIPSGDFNEYTKRCR
jgi:gamma-glutamylcyclotransferase (GGCT)/AIG2-like uncharacterized protein YtfP